MNKTIIMAVCVAVVVGGIGFLAGTKYEAGKSSQVAAGGQGQFRQGGQGGRFRTAGGGFVTGDIISQDANSITIKMRNGSSQIVLFSASTEIGKFVKGSVTDLAVGKTVTATGQTNSDGSITAQSIQVRPPMPSPSPSASQ